MRREHKRRFSDIIGTQQETSDVLIRFSLKDAAERNCEFSKKKKKNYILAGRGVGKNCVLQIFNYDIAGRRNKKNIMTIREFNLKRFQTGKRNLISSE